MNTRRTTALLAVASVLVLGTACVDTQSKIKTIGGVALYKNESKDLFSITGLGINGTAKTNSTLVLVVTTGELIATSTKGECAITVNHGDGDSVSGTANCTNLDSSQGNVDLKATFSASP